MTDPVVLSPTNTNDLLSYHRSVASLNTDSESLTTFPTLDPLLAPATIASAVPSNISTPAKSNTSPDILQLQASICAMKQRITTIQEVTTSRFESIHFDFRQNQNELAKILTDRLQDISAKRNEDMQTIQNQFAHHQRQPSPPPTVSFLGSPDIRFTTSSLGEPPASCEMICSYRLEQTTGPTWINTGNTHTGQTKTNTKTSPSTTCAYLINSSGTCHPVSACPPTTYHQYKNPERPHSSHIQNVQKGQ